MELTIIDRLYQDNHGLTEFLERSGESALREKVESHFRKTLLLSAASYFEAAIRDALIELFGERTNHAMPLVHFVKNKAIERQYHTYFTWDGRNANSFFGLFGGEFREFMIQQVKSDSQLETSVKAFLEVGMVRNQLVHQDFGTFELDKTVEEIYELYKRGKFFVDAFPMKLREFINSDNKTRTISV